MVFDIPFFGPSPFDKLVEKATNEANVTEDWESVLECCDFINGQQSRPVDYLKSILKRMGHTHPNIAIQSVILLDACVSNCGKKFHLEVASRDFIAEARKLLEKGHPKVVERFKLILRKWAENEFKSDPELSLIPTFYLQLKKEGFDFTDPSKPDLPKDPNIVISDQEEEDIIKALELSMKDVKQTRSTPSGSSRSNAGHSSSQNTSSSLYPDVQASASIDNMNNSTTASDSNSNQISTNNKHQQKQEINTKQKESYKVRALYDFEAAEDNELTFKAGEIIVVTDDHDDNWWSGNNHRGEGYFPANFVTNSLDASFDNANSNGNRSVQFNDQVKVKFLEEEVTEIDESKIDRLLHLMNVADPTGEKPDSDELILLEDQCNKMGKLVDTELERLDRVQVSLNTAHRQIDEAMYLYLGVNPAAAAYQMPMVKSDQPQ